MSVQHLMEIHPLVIVIFQTDRKLPEKRLRVFYYGQRFLNSTACTLVEGNGAILN